MLYLVIERFKNGDAGPVGERFRAQGRMMPEGLAYRDSWVELGGARCYQLMEAAAPELLDQWTAMWADLVDFEVIAVMPSAEFWTGRLTSPAGTD